MKEIKITKLEIKNFRNITEMNIDLGEKTIFKGKNKLGKTNILHSIVWCLFGKNIYNEKLFTISPIIDNVEDNSILTNVKLVINGEYVISRSYKDRTTKLEVGFIDSDGKENCVSMTQSQYLKDLEEKYVNEETFKSLTNIEYITNIHWKELKELIFSLIGDIKDEEVLLRSDFKGIVELITNFGIDKTIEQLNSTDKALNEEIKVLETEYQAIYNLKEKYVSNQEDNDKLLARKKEIEDTLYASKEKQEEYQKELDSYKDKKNVIEELQRKIDNKENTIEYNKTMISDYENLYKQNSYDVELLRQKEINEVKNEISKLTNNIQYTNSQIEYNEKHLEDMKVKGNELKSKEIKIENSKCSSCGQDLPEEMQQATLNKLKEEQLQELSKIKQEYDLTKEHLEDNKKNLNELDDEITLLNHKLEEIKTKEYEAIDETDKQKQIRVAKEQKELENKTLLEEFVELKENYSKLKEEFDSLKKPINLFEDNLPLRIELNEITDKLATTTTLSKLDEDLKEIKNKLDTKKDNKISNKEKLQECVKFNNIKADLLKEKTKRYFSLVSFRTKEFTNDGSEVETFKIVNANNVEYKECSTGEKILLGVELLSVIQEFKGIKLPIIIDEISVLTSDIECKTQLIGTIADRTKDKIEIEVK